MSDSNAVDNINKVYGHLMFPYTSCTKRLFLKERNVTCYTVSKESDETFPQSIPEEFRTFLESSMGFEVILVKKAYLVGVKEICGNRINVKKVRDCGEVKQLLITIEASNLDDVNKKTKDIQEFVKNRCYVISDKYTFTKTDRC